MAFAPLTAGKRADLGYSPAPPRPPAKRASRPSLMPKPAAYDLFVLLDLESPDERRAGVIDQVRRQIQERGDLKGDVDWGSRKLAYEIDHRGEAQYHLFQFEATSDLLSELDRSLSIEDAVIRHRIIRLPGEAPTRRPSPRPKSRGARRSGATVATGVTEGVAAGPAPTRRRQQRRGSPGATRRGGIGAACRGGWCRPPRKPLRRPAAESPAEPAPAAEPVAAEQPAGDSAEQA